MVNKLWIKIALPIVLVSWVLLEAIIQIALNGFIERHRGEIGERLRDVAIVAASSIRGEDHEQALTPDSTGLALFATITKPLAQMRVTLGYSENWYTLLPSNSPTTMFGIMTHDKPFVGDPYTFRDTAVYTIFRRAANEGQPGFTGLYRSDNGVWISGFAPIRTSAGKAVAVLEVDISYKEYLAEEDKIKLWAWLARGIGVFISMIVGIILSRWIASPIVQLRNIVHEIDVTGASDKTFEALDLQRNDEIGALGKTFRVMVENLQKASEAAELERTTSVHKAEEAARSARNEVLEQQQYLESEVQRIGEFLNNIRNNDLRGNLTNSKDDAVGHLVRTLNEAIDAQRGVIVEMQDAAVALAVLSQEIAGKSDQISEHSKVQAIGVGGIVRSIEEMSSFIADTAQNIATTSDLSADVVGSAKSGQQAVRQTLEGMTTISDVVKSMALIITKLNESSAQIGGFAKTIAEIADQTNLLALNAAIEAARAGEAGRGFAVVADEVRKLAEKTQHATKEITRTIGVIQNDTREASTAANTGANQVQQGITLAQNAGGRLDAIVSGIEHLNELIIQIATASEKQSASAQEITSSVEKVQQGIEANTTDIHGVAASVTVVNQQAEHLREVSGQFILNETDIQRQLPSGAKKMLPVSTPVRKKL